MSTGNGVEGSSIKPGGGESSLLVEVVPWYVLNSELRRNPSWLWCCGSDEDLIIIIDYY